MARIEIPMPQMGESIAEGTVSVWLKKVGERVERDEGIMEIATDKVDAEIPSPAAGVLAEILVPEGETVEVGSVVGYIETDVEAFSTAPAPDVGDATGTPEPPASSEDGRDSEGSATTEAGEGAWSLREDSRAASPAAVDSGRPEEGEDERLRRHSSPLVRRMAAEHGVALAEVEGSGRGGRVTKRDMERYLEAHAAGTGPSRRATPKRVGDTLSWSDYYSEVQHPTIAPGPGDRIEPMNRLTAIAAEHMILSRRISAHVHSIFEVDYSRIDRIRARDRQLWADQGLKVTYTVFIARAVARALREHPRINAAISGTRVVYRSEVNLGIAVALEQGLIVPVIRRADELSLTGLARAIDDLATRARARQLSPEEIQGGTFTLTNPGGFGSIIGFPILHQPQVGILAVGAVEKRPVVLTDEFGNDAIVARKRGLMTLGFDHRLINGADADRFLARVKELLEEVDEER